jgi:hypothetical protein
LSPGLAPAQTRARGAKRRTEQLDAKITSLQREND